MAIYKNPRLVLVEWHDAHSDGGWLNKRDLEDFLNRDKCICQNVGWLISETKDELVLGCRKMKWAEDGDEEWGMVQKIPKAWIRIKKIIIK